MIERSVATRPATLGSTFSPARSSRGARNLAIAKKCGNCQTNKMANSAKASRESEPVTLAQPISGGIAPGIAPTWSDQVVTRLSGVYASTYDESANQPSDAESELTDVASSVS